jgi:hypothetical protein
MEILVLKRNRQVVFIAEDGFQWGSREVDDSDFAIIRVPDGVLGGDVLQAQAAHCHTGESPRSIVTRGPGGFALRRPPEDPGPPVSLPVVTEMHGTVPDGS